MAESSPTKREKTQADEAKASQTDVKVVDSWEEASKVGYFGSRPRQTHDDEEYALTSGPDSPTGERGPE
jgi:hypothetical protein